MSLTVIPFLIYFICFFWLGVTFPLVALDEILVLPYQTPRSSSPANSHCSSHVQTPISRIRSRSSIHGSSSCRSLTYRGSRNKPHCSPVSSEKIRPKLACSRMDLPDSLQEAVSKACRLPVIQVVVLPPVPKLLPLPEDAGRGRSFEGSLLPSQLQVEGGGGYSRVALEILAFLWSRGLDGGGFMFQVHCPLPPPPTCRS